MTTTALSEVLAEMDRMPQIPIAAAWKRRIESALASAEPVAWRDDVKTVVDWIFGTVGKIENVQLLTDAVVKATRRLESNLSAMPAARPAAKFESLGMDADDWRNTSGPITPAMIGAALESNDAGVEEDPDSYEYRELIADRLNALISAAQTPAIVLPDGFYLASFKRKDCSGAMLWWGPDNAGYTTDIEQAGIYTEITPGYHDSDHTVPVPVSFLDGCRIRRTLDPGDSKNRAFWSAADLRAAISNKSEPTP